MVTNKRWAFKKNKSGVTNCCNAKGIKIQGEVCLASVKKSLYKLQEVYWANNDDKMFLDRDWTFIFHNQYRHTFYIINIPQGQFTPDLSKVNRKDGLVDWNVKVGLYRDIDSGFNFGQFGVQEYTYNDQDIKDFDI